MCQRTHLCVKISVHLPISIRRGVAEPTCFRRISERTTIRIIHFWSSRTSSTVYDTHGKENQPRFFRISISHSFAFSHLYFNIINMQNINTWWRKQILCSCPWSAEAFAVDVPYNLGISTAPTKTKARKPSYLQALNQNKVGSKSRDSSRQRDSDGFGGWCLGWYYKGGRGWSSFLSFN